MTLERSQRALARARAKAHKTVDDFPLVTITDVGERVELRRVTGILGAETVFVDVTGVTEALSDDDLIRVWPQPDKAGIYKFHSFVRRSGTNTAGDVFVPDLQTNTVRGPHGFTVEVFDTIGDPGGGHQSKFEWSQAGGVWRIHPAEDGSPAGLDLVDGNITLPAGGTVDGVDVSDDVILKSEFAAKGDLLVGTGAGMFAALGVGSDGAFLIPDSGEPTRLKWTTTLKETATALVVNDSQAVDKDFIVKGKTDAQLIVADYDKDTVAIGGGALSDTKLRVCGRVQIESTFTNIYALTVGGTVITNVGRGIIQVQANVSPSAANLTLYGQIFLPTLYDSAQNVATLNCLYVRGDTAASYTGDLSNLYGLNIANTIHAGSGTIANQTQLYIAQPTQGTANWAIYATGKIALFAGTATNRPLLVRGAASQTANLQEWQNSAGTVLFEVEADGILDFRQTMGNSTKDPTTDAPADWVQCKIAGSTYYLPAYAA